MRNSRLNALIRARRDPFAQRFRIGADLGVELAPLELLLPNPKPSIRWHDDIDLAARSLHDCPICGARRGIVCSWAELRAITSWCAHDGRRRLVDAIVDAAALRIFGALRRRG